jgi:hypothetical protein
VPPGNGAPAVESQEADITESCRVVGRPRSTPNHHPEVEKFLAAVSAHAGYTISLSDVCLVSGFRDDTTFGAWRRGDESRYKPGQAKKFPGFPGLTFKQCRTTFATLVDADVADAQAMLGHHSPAVTLPFYKKAIPPRQQEAVDKLESKLKVVPISKGVA